MKYLNVPLKCAVFTEWFPSDKLKLGQRIHDEYKLAFQVGRQSNNMIRIIDQQVEKDYEEN